MRIAILGEDGGRVGQFEQALADFGLDWEVERPLDPAHALDACEPIDVYVATRAQAELLKQVRERHPSAVRVLLVEAEQETDVLQALDSAHRLLRVPLDAGELIEAVESLADLRELLGNADLKRRIGAIGSLPPPPRVYIELTQLLRDPEASNGEIADVLAQDPAIAAKVLRLCNSAYFSGGRQITDFRMAVTRLGHQAIRRLVLASETFGSIQSASRVDRDALQDRALRTSRLAGRLLAGASAELAVTAGLLSEIGLLLPGVGADGGPHYAEAGAYLLGLWGLPMPIVEAVAYHHNPARVRSGGFWVTGAVHVAFALVTGTEVDEAYLRTVGVHDKLPRWREMVAQMADAA
ncbi:HDOD domain-containing protein [Cognatiluteimonas weifangensis]|uniref:HDOD domain-containing protein n=1 Tax=Cognatiluteimonas weifangensis TaxID=2303539 RepID=UPI001F1D5F39|nr:HDOD domain-containing protein [Luteimonas weifangensis]